MEFDFETDEEFRSLLPPHSAEERESLESLIVAERRALEPLTVWEEQNILVDGYTRFEICNDHGFQFDVRRKSFESREAARIWVRQNQIGRRNLTAQTKKVQLGKLAKELEKLQGGSSTHRKKNVVKELSEQHSVSERTIARGKKIATFLESIIQPVRVRYENGDLKLTDREVEALADLSKDMQLSLIMALDDKTYPDFWEAHKQLVERSVPQRQTPSQKRKARQAIREEISDAPKSADEASVDEDESTEQMPEGMMQDAGLKSAPGVETTLNGIDAAIEQALIDLRKLLDRRSDYVGKTPRHMSTVNVLRHLHTQWVEFKKDRNTSRGTIR